MITLFAGCSFTSGCGFKSRKDEQGLWVNLLHSNNEILKKTELLNVGEDGRSNSGILHDAIYHILYNDVKYAFVAWTSEIRYKISIGLEWYDTTTFFMPDAKHRDHFINNINYPASYIQNLNDRVTSLIHPHYEIVSLLKYLDILVGLCKLKQCQLFFINALCGWDNEYFLRKSNIMPIDYTNYTKELISVDTRSDIEIFKLYEKIHNEYDRAGGIKEHLWLNLYSSYASTMIDRNDDMRHPGLQSNYNFYKQIAESLELKIS